MTDSFALRPHISEKGTVAPAWPMPGKRASGPAGSCGPPHYGKPETTSRGVSKSEIARRLQIGRPHARGLICLTITGERADSLESVPVASRNTSCGGTGSTLSTDAKEQGAKTGTSAYERCRMILAAIHPNTRPEDLAGPGHIFPLRARRDGVLERRGHTEAAVDLARLAGWNPAGVICEILNDDGAMARLPDLVSFCAKHDLKMISVTELARYRHEFDADQFWLHVEAGS
jgi:3,4-dihydroxy-2-butanone 4-phosphate synthase